MGQEMDRVLPSCGQPKINRESVVGIDGVIPWLT